MESSPQYVLSNLLPIVEIIFSYLNAKSLCRAAQACRTWRDASFKELKKRGWCLGLISYDNQSDEPAHKQLLPGLRAYLRELPIVPETILIVKCHVEDEDIEDDDEEAEEEVGLLNDIVKSAIVKPINLLCTFVGGVICSNGYGISSSIQCDALKRNTVEIQNEEALSLLALKQRMNIKYRHFVSTASQVKKAIRSNLNIFQMISMDISQEKNITIVLLVKDISFSVINKMIDLIKKIERDKHVIIIGGHCNHLQDLNGVIDKGMMGVVFYGDTLDASLNIHTRSSLDILTDSLNDMKRECVGTRKNKELLMLMISCVGRGEDFYDGKANVETGIVNKIFPNLPVFGFFGYGEIVYDSHIFELFDDCNFFSTSVFCLLSSRKTGP